MKKLLFLDIDGVLNSVTFAHYCNILQKQNPDEELEWRPYKDFDPMCLTNFVEVVESTGCEIVWSTTWRLGRSVEELNEIVEAGFKRWGIDFKVPGIGKTPCLREELGWGVARGLEIQRWLDENIDEKWGDKVTYAIVDDDSDMAHLHGHFVNTDGYVGMTWRDAEKLKRILVELKPWGTHFEDNGWYVKFPLFGGALGKDEFCGPFSSEEDAIRFVQEKGITSFKTFKFREYPSKVYENGQIKKS